MNKQEWISKAEEKGFEGFEISQSVSRSKSVSWFDGSVDSFVTSKVISTSLRGMIQGKIVSISLEKVDDESMDYILDQLLEQAQVIPETEKDELVPVIETEETLSLTEWVRPSMEQIEKSLSSLEALLKSKDSRVTMVNGLSWEEAVSSKSLTNSLGVQVNDELEYQLLSAQVTMEENGELRDGYEVAVVYDLAGFDLDSLASKLVEKVAADLGAASIKSRQCPVIFKNDAMSTLFGCFVPAFYGSLIAKGISPLTGKEGEKIWSDKITVVDNPRSQDSLFLKNYDDEGHPTYDKVVVDHGVFSTILHNTRSALKMGAQSTGNGFKSGGGATDVSALNMYIVPGKDDLAQLEQTMENGVVITNLAGMHAGVNFVTANFSLQARGYLVENGKKVRPLTLITVAGNFNDMMNHVVKVGKDLDWSYHSVVCPSILFDQLSIGGKE